MEGRRADRVAIVTGAAGGIGAALSRALVRRGASVVLADIDGDGAARTAEELDRAGPGTATGVEVDVADAAAVAELITSTHDRAGRLDLLFNNAGIGALGEPEDTDLAHWQQAIDVNLKGVIHGCQAAYPLMQAQGWGHIVNTASLAGLIGGLFSAVPYTTTKHAVVGLSQALRTAGAGHGIRVSVLCPGGVETGIWDRPSYRGLEEPGRFQELSLRDVVAEMGIGRFQDPDTLAEQVLRGVAANRAFIVAPASARLAWRLYRLAPGALLRGSIWSAERFRRAHPRPAGDPPATLLQ